jgi:hypothetical protein
MIFLVGCSLKLEPLWQEASPDNPTTQSLQKLSDAKVLFSKADSANSLKKSIAAFESVLDENPGDYEALALLSTQYVLMGTAYTEGRSEKSALFHKAMKYAEIAMYTNPVFRARVANGESPWDATNALGPNELSAMYFWVIALQYEFKEVMFLPGKIANVNWLQKGLVLLNQIEKIDPEFGGGGVEFCKVICLYALPKFKGGSPEKGDEYMRKAVKKGSNWLLPRWARGKYYYQAIKNEPEKSRQDLEWVAQQDLSNYQDPYPWRVHFKKDAQKLISKADH